MLTNSPVVRSAGARILFLLSAAATVAILLWMHHMRLNGQLGGLTPIFFVLFAYEDYGAVVVALLILLAAALVPAQSPARTAFRRAGAHPVAIAIASLLVMCVGALAVYHNHPLCMDEYAAYFQSRVFAAGHLTGQFPAPLLDWLIPAGFQDHFLSVSKVSGRVVSQYWPSFALLLTPFTWLRIPWACNPLISALTLLVIYRLALELFDDRETAGLALLFTVASPVFFANGISYYSMPAHLLANCTYALLLIAPTSRRAFLAGVVGSIALTLHNPVPHLLFALPWLIWVARRENGWRLFCWLSAGYVPLSLLLGVGWFWLYQHLANEGVSAAAATSSSLAPVLGVFALPSPTILLARLIGVAKIWVWAVPGLLILAGAGAWKWRDDHGCRLLWSSALLTLVGYLFVPVDQGHGWGFRYFHSAWVALPMLAAAALKRRPAMGSQPEDDGVRAFAVACAVLTLVAGVGQRALQMREFIGEDLAQVPAYSGTQARVVILDTTEQFYGADLVQNDPWLRGNLIRMVSHGRSEDAAMMRAAFPTLHQVFADRFGTVWSAARPQAGASR